ncbi:6-phosphogluconolactonase [Phenylobacterium sp.]|uniref:6-phosphogluconolactonase n=1 Tax=Phenylobacterium sp. TaxID=1871053 RepID=UPI0035B3EBC2
MIEAFSNQTSAADAAAAFIADHLSRALGLRGRAVFVATGGRSPGPVYDRLAHAALDWTRVVVTLSDDRFVPPDHEASNAALVNAHLRVGPAARSIFAPLYSAADSPEAAALAAEPVARALVPADVVHLGMGDDGHIASLIPGSPVLEAGMDPDSDRVLLGVPAGVGSPPLARITMTRAALLKARAILITVAGEAKREVLRAAAGGADYPVRAIVQQTETPVRIIWSP